jgi:hypothetical protein
MHIGGMSTSKSNNTMNNTQNKPFPQAQLLATPNDPLFRTKSKQAFQVQKHQQVITPSIMREVQLQ